MKLKAYPKINLCLKVYKGIVDGKHKIDSIMYLYTKIYDTITITKGDELYVSYKEGKKQISLNDCLISKSLKYLNVKYGVDVNYHIQVTKNIPFGAGLGGGSADAAAVINYILEKNPQIVLDLRDIAIELGSDIPFFLSEYKIARVRDFGQFVTPIYNWQPKVELYIPSVFCSTTTVFNSLEEDPEYVSKVDVDKIIKNHLYKQHLTNVVYNDLTKYIIQNYKELQPAYSNARGAAFFTGTGGTLVKIEE